MVRRWFPRKDSNLRSRIQSPLPYRLATRDRLVTESEVVAVTVPVLARDAAPQQYANGGPSEEPLPLTSTWAAVTSPTRPALCLAMRNALLLMILVATAACGAYRFPSPGNGSGTVSGQVMATQCGPGGPAAQPCLPGAAPDCISKNPTGGACGTRPVPGLELVFTNGSTSLSTGTDSGGSYSIELPSGTWTVGTKSFVRIVSGPQTLVVSAGASIIANYIVDIGIRAAFQPGSAAGSPTPVDAGA